MEEEASAAPTKHIALLPKYDAIMPDSGKGGLPKKTHSKASGKSARNRQRKVPVIQPAIKNLQKKCSGHEFERFLRLRQSPCEPVPTYGAKKISANIFVYKINYFIFAKSNPLKTPSI
ncbi:hypothetical protein [uncultured Alistipes sp.]|uniref:hypothetical protein n=1 Tax=uncultured Alistipes sp. TaxID=538949 RepID=UPI00272CB669|nr:hypothetical protein [uncultured Alistipes sp.]